LSDAVTVIVTRPETVCPAVGEVTDTAGAVVSAFATLTVTLAEAVLPAASEARALST
jgi:hypothetical protein